MAHGRNSLIVGKLYFQNQDNEWEEFPSDEDLQAARNAAYDLQELGFAMICQLCNTAPTVAQIKHRALQHSWKCDKCHTINSAGRA